MKKSIYLAALASLALTACSSDDNDIFDQSAADRLEQYKKDYADVLTAEGGLWTMEYFSNTDEPGYLFVMKFEKNGAVIISANHKWIGGTFKQETSLWKMIADNGPVLSFNSYNNLFHIFSDPANIEGPDAPLGDMGDDINETGYGHEGDYEFQFMEVSDDGQTVRLLGKKRLYDIFLHRLDPNTDVSALLENTSHISDFISPYFGYLNLVAADGEEFVVNKLESGIPSVYPKLGDDVTQTRSGNGIFTLDGFRFMDPLEVPRAKESADPILLESFNFDQDGSLIDANGNRIVGPYALDVFLNSTMSYSWGVDLNEGAGSLADNIATLVAGIKDAYPNRSLESVNFGHAVYDGKVNPCINIKISGAQPATYYIDYSSQSDDGVSFNVTSCNSQALTLEKKTLALSQFVNALASHTFVVSSENLMSPEVLKICDKNNHDSYMVVKVF